MAKTLTCFLLTLLVGTFISCASAPAPDPEETPVSPSAETPEPITSAPPPATKPAPALTGGSLAEINARYRPLLNTAGATTYTVVWRDYLAGLANRIWGRENGFFFPLIMLASGTTITDPDLIISGRRLTIPSIRANLDTPSTRAQIKLYLGEVAGWYDRERPRDRRTPAGLRTLASKL